MALRVRAVSRDKFWSSDDRGSALALRFQASDRTVTGPGVGEIQACWTRAGASRRVVGIRDGDGVRHLLGLSGTASM